MVFNLIPSKNLKIDYPQPKWIGYHKDNTKMMKQPKQLSSTHLRMSNIMPLSCCWIN
jgi:hypothetical protein